MYKIYYYEKNSRFPVLEFIKKLQPKSQAKIARSINLLEEFGFRLSKKYIKKITGTFDLWELRIQHSSNNYRIFFFLYHKEKFILLHAFTKKTMKTPQKEIKAALANLTEFKKQRSDN